MAFQEPPTGEAPFQPTTPEKLQEQSDLEASFDRIRSMLEALHAGEGVTLTQIKAGLNDIILFTLNDRDAKIPLVDAFYQDFKNSRRPDYESAKNQFSSNRRRLARKSELDYDCMVLAIYEVVNQLKTVIEA